MVHFKIKALHSIKCTHLMGTLVTILSLRTSLTSDLLFCLCFSVSIAMLFTALVTACFNRTRKTTASWQVFMFVSFETVNVL